MPMHMKLEPETASLTVGEGYQKENSIEFNVMLTGKGAVWLTMELPVSPNGVLRQIEDANEIAFPPSPRNAHPLPDPLPSDAEDLQTWSLGDYDKGINVNGKALVPVSIGKILCLASEGKRKLVVTAVTEDNFVLKQELEITIAANQKNPILSFTAAPANLIGSGRVTLSWDLLHDQNVTLSAPPLVTPVGTPLRNQQTFELADTGTFSLAIKGKPAQSRSVTVSVLPSNKWYSFKPLGEKAFPSVIFDSAGLDQDALYAIFVLAERKAVLCRSADGITGWEVIDEDVPDGMETSPGVLLNKRLWLIGGSSVDPEVISGSIFYYDLNAASKGWQQASVSDFADQERMGHACTVDGNGIWVLGGQDQYGAGLRDVFLLQVDTSGAISKAVKGTVPFSPRCMFSVLNFNNRIWVCGGVTSPNGNPLGKDNIVRTRPSPTASDLAQPDKLWLEYKGPRELVNAIGTGVASCSNRLFAFLTTRVEENGAYWDQKLILKPLVQDAEFPTWGAGIAPEVSDKEPWYEWTIKPHSICMVGFKNRLYLRYLHRNAMHNEQIGAPLFVFVR